jgi:hypothetical protein
MTELGFKILTPKDWLEPDETSLKLLTGFATGQQRQDPGARWINHVLESCLSHGVPLDVRKLFEVARATIAYGILFYPLFALGLEQLARVAEAAIVHKCRAVEIDAHDLSMFDAIESLAKAGELSEDEKALWHSLRKARNVASHAKSQMILPPGMVLGAIGRYASHINSLFAGA